MKKSLSIVSLLAILCLTSCKATPLMNPGRVMVDGSSHEQVQRAITDALARRGWLLSDMNTETIDASLHLRDHLATIQIEYDADFFNIKYMDSTNLGYKKINDGSEFIHRNYNSWIRNLTQDIVVNANHSG